MEISDFIPLQLTKNVCRTCLAEIEANFVGLEDEVSLERPTKLIEMLVSLGCVEELGDDNWPHNICDQCATNVIVAYNFKITCLKSTKTLLDHLCANSSYNLPEIDSTGIIHKDHEYELPFLSHPGIGESIAQDLDFITPTMPEIKLDIDTQMTDIDLNKQKKALEEEADKQFPCKMCNSGFNNVHSLKFHIKYKHEKRKQKLCQVCGKDFDTKGSLMQHIKTHDAARYRCQLCDKLLKSKQMFKQHFRLFHSDNRYAYKCTQCGKDLTTKGSLVKHMLIHDENRPIHSCPNCPKKFIDKKSLRYHLKSHTTAPDVIKRFVCTHEGCSKNFNKKRSLYLHTAQCHSEERPFVCKICSKDYATETHFREHMRRHESPICIGCGAMFNTKIGLKRHLKEDTECRKIKTGNLAV